MQHASGGSTDRVFAFDKLSITNYDANLPVVNTTQKVQPRLIGQ